MAGDEVAHVLGHARVARLRDLDEDGRWVRDAVVELAAVVPTDASAAALVGATAIRVGVRRAASGGVGLAGVHAALVGRRLQVVAAREAGPLYAELEHDVVVAECPDQRRDA